MKTRNTRTFSGKSTTATAWQSFRKSKLWCAVFITSLLMGLFTLSQGLSPMSYLPGGNGTVNAAVESISTFAANCTTPQSSWTLGGTVCASASGLPLGGQRRFMWVAPDGTVPQVATVNADPDTDSYTLPLTGAFAQPGRWTVKIVDKRGVGRVSATFEVLSPGTNADLSVSKTGPAQATAGANLTYTVTVTNNGPDAAQDVELEDLVPINTTFVSSSQVSGPPFSCSNTTIDEIVRTSCTITSLPANTSASFSFVYNLAASAEGTIIFNEATVSSATSEVNQFNNSEAVITLISATAPCTLSCPANISQDSDAGQCGAIVNYTAPTGSNCAGVTCSPDPGAFFPLGVSTVVCTGSTGEPCRFTVTINDTGSHNLVCPANITANESPAGSGYATVNYTPPSSSNCSGEVITCDPPPGFIFPNGTTTVTCSSSAGPTCSFTVTVNPFAGCVINCPGNLTIGTDAGQCSATYTYATPTTSGPCGAVTCTPPSGSVLPPGTATITCSEPGGTSCSFTVTVIDTEEPAITCPANITKPVDAGQCSTTVSYSTPSASDNCSGVGAVSCSPPSGSVFPSGVTEVSCTALDTAGNLGSCGFTVTVTETQPPTISCPANMAILSADECVVVEFATAANDNCPGVSVVCVPDSGTCFDQGVTVVNCVATDRAGNTASCSFTVTIGICTLTCPANVTVTNDANQCGAVVNYPAPTGTNCGTVSCSPASGSFFPKGTTTVSCSSTAGSNCSFTVTVNDTQAPTLVCPANVTATLPLNSTATSMAVSYTAPVATDNCPGVGAPVCTPASGSTFSVGTTTVNCTVQDAAGNSASCSFTVNVAYSFTGFFQPVSNLPSVNVVNAGRAIPVKFSLSGNKGLNIFAAGYPVSGVIVCDSTAPPVEVVGTITAGGSSLSYDAGSDQYVYVWKTENSWAGTCRQLIVRLNDGNQYVANFRFR
jgi:uncharacterized repeat protein (TIGR01451 family)